MNIGKENEIVEFKEGLSQLDKGLKSLSAMLNKHFEGCVYFGVKDDGTVVGEKNIGNQTDIKIKTRIRELIEPRFFYKVESLNLGDETVIKISASGSDIPYSFDGRYFIRNTKSDEIADSTILRQMLRNNKIDILKESPVLNKNLTFNYLDTALKKSGIHNYNLNSYLQNNQITLNGQKYNQMSLLVSDQNQLTTKIIAFAGYDKTNMLSKYEISNGSLLKQVDEVLQYFKILNKTKINLSEGIRIETPLFNFESFREGWINACVHNDWTQQLAPSIYIYDDRFEIESYGSLPFNLSIEDFYDGKSMPVNKSLFNIFLACRYSEQSGHGIRIIKSVYGEKAFNITKNMIKVIIPFAFERDEVVVRKCSKLNLTSNQQKIYDLICEIPGITLKKVSSILDLSLSYVKKVVSLLVSKKLLTRTGTKKVGKWVKLEQ